MRGAALTPQCACENRGIGLSQLVVQPLRRPRAQPRQPQRHIADVDRFSPEDLRARQMPRDAAFGFEFAQRRFTRIARLVEGLALSAQQESRSNRVRRLRSDAVPSVPSEKRRVAS